MTVTHALLGLIAYIILLIAIVRLTRGGGQ